MSNLSGKTLEGRYLIGEMIGRGGMANVYTAKDLVGDRKLAVKVLKSEFAEDAESLRRFKNESKAIALLSHPGIIKVYDLCFTDEIKGIVMEYINGITLKDYLEKQETLSPQEVLFFGRQILKAIGHAHQKGVVHRDLKPQNILMTEQGILKISDFGIARFARNENRTINDKTIGTVGYISPEQAKGEISDGRSDIYSLGVMFYEMTTGRLPFSGETPVSVALKHIEQQAPPPTAFNPNLAKGLEEIILKAMAKNPDDRYQNCEEMLKDLEQFRGNPSIVFGYRTQEKERSHIASVKRRSEPEKGDGQNKKRKSTPQKSTQEKLPSEKEPRAAGNSVIPILTGVTAAFVLVTILFIATMFYLYNPFEPVENIEVPTLVGLGYDAVKDEEIYKQLDIVVEETQYNDIYGEGIIYYQSPKPGIDVKHGAKIKVKVSKGQKIVQVPQVIGAEETAAYQMLVDTELRYSKVTMYTNTMPAGYVIASEPGAGSSVSAGSEVKLTISLGPENAFVAVPELSGLTREQAQALLETLGLNIGGVSYVTADQPNGTVVAQDPASGNEVAVGTYININVAGEASLRNSVSLNVPMPSIQELSDVAIMVGGSIIHSERVSPAEIGYWSPTLTGSGVEQVMIFIDSKLYMVYELDYAAGTAKLTEDNSGEF